MPFTDLASYSLEPTVDPDLRAVLIGGGQAYNAGPTDYTNDPLLELGLDMSGVIKPNVLIVPSARWKAAAKAVDKLLGYYHDRGLPATSLHPFLYESHSLAYPTLEDLPIDPDVIPSPAELTDKTEAADVVFILGGDTNRMLNQVWSHLGIDTLLKQAVKRGAIMSGTSAGTVAWFKGGQTDGNSLKTAKSQTYHYVSGLNLIHQTIAGPHYDSAPLNHPGRPRQKSFNDMLYRRRALGELGLGIDNNAALQVIGNGMLRVAEGNAPGRRTITSMHYRVESATH